MIYKKMSNNELIQMLGTVMGCLENLEDRGDGITIKDHYDCMTDLLEIQRQLKARKEEVKEVRVGCDNCGLPKPVQKWGKGKKDNFDTAYLCKDCS